MNITAEEESDGSSNEPNSTASRSLDLNTVEDITQTDQKDEKNCDRNNLNKSSVLSGHSDIIKAVGTLTVEKLTELENTLKTADDISDISEIFYETPLACLKEDTLECLCILDDLHDIQSDKNRCKDFRGLAELVISDKTVCPAYINHLIKSVHLKKVKEIINKWIGQNGGPSPVIGNLRTFIADADEGIDRPDVITDLAAKISLDACHWEKTKLEAKPEPPTPADTSWQMTIHDEKLSFLFEFYEEIKGTELQMVVSSSKTYYTCCLSYADEDEEMAQLITRLFRQVHSPIRFFLPQFDMIQSRYEAQATAEVIAESEEILCGDSMKPDQCNGKVIFIISKYFLQSDICQFAVNFSKTLDVAAKTGNLIPFYMSNMKEHIPYVLSGICGMKWYIKSRRKQIFLNLASTLLMGSAGLDDAGRNTLQDIDHLLDSDESQQYLIDPPYEGVGVKKEMKADAAQHSCQPLPKQDSNEASTDKRAESNEGEASDSSNSKTDGKEKNVKRSLFKRLFSNKK